MLRLSRDIFEFVDFSKFQLFDDFEVLFQFLEVICNRLEYWEISCTRFCIFGVVPLWKTDKNSGDLMNFVQTCTVGTFSPCTIGGRGRTESQVPIRISSLDRNSYVEVSGRETIFLPETAHYFLETLPGWGAQFSIKGNEFFSRFCSARPSIFDERKWGKFIYWDLCDVGQPDFGPSAREETVTFGLTARANAVRVGERKNAVYRDDVVAKKRRVDRIIHSTRWGSTWKLGARHLSFRS